MLRVTLTMQNRIRGTIGGRTVRDITDDLVEGSLDEFSRRLSGVGLFEIEANDVQLELINNGSKYFKSIRQGGEVFSIRGSTFSSEGYQGDWHMERIAIYEDSNLRFVGFILAEDAPIVYDRDVGIVSFTAYDPMYFLKKYQISLPGYTETGAARYKNTQRYTREVDVMVGDNTIQRLLVIDYGTFKELPLEEQLRYEKKYIFNTLDSGAIEPNSAAYDEVDLADYANFLDPNTYTGYLRRPTSIPVELNIISEIIPKMLQGFNMWCPFFGIQLITDTSDVDTIARPFTIKLDYEDDFARFDVYQTNFASDPDETLLVGFFNESNEHVDKYKRIRIDKVKNQVALNTIYDREFEALPNTLIMTLEYDFNVGGYEDENGNKIWEKFYMAAGDLTLNADEMFAGIQRTPRTEGALIAWRMRKRSYEYVWLNHRIDVFIYDYQYVIMDVKTNGIYKIKTISVQKNNVQGVLTRPEDYDPLAGSFIAVTDEGAVGDGNSLELTSIAPLNKYDSNQIATWNDYSDRYYAPSPTGPGVFYIGSPTMSSVTLDYHNTALGTALLDFAKITNSMFRLLIGDGENLFKLAFGSRQYKRATITVTEADIIDVEEEYYQLLNNDIPQITTGIIENAAYNKALSDFYAIFFGKKYQVYKAEIIKGCPALNNTYDLMYQLKRGSKDLGVIHSINDKPDTVEFETRLYVQNINVRRIS